MDADEIMKAMRVLAMCGVAEIRFATKEDLAKVLVVYVANKPQWMLSDRQPIPVTPSPSIDGVRLTYESLADELEAIFADKLEEGDG